CGVEQMISTRGRWRASKDRGSTPCVLAVNQARIIAGVLPFPSRRGRRSRKALPGSRTAAALTLAVPTTRQDTTAAAELAHSPYLRPRGRGRCGQSHPTPPSCLAPHAPLPRDGALREPAPSASPPPEQRRSLRRHGFDALPHRGALNAFVD